jgi:hypothetical protein
MPVWLDALPLEQARPELALRPEWEWEPQALVSHPCQEQERRELALPQEWEQERQELVFNRRTGADL